MTALADAAFLVESLDLKTDYSPLHRDDLCGGSHHCADRRRGKMADIDLYKIFKFFFKILTP